MQDPKLRTESVEFEVRPRAPRLRLGAIGWAIAGVFVLIVASVVVVALTSSAGPGGDVLAKVMPADTLFYFSMATRPDQMPHFDVVAEAWRDSKEAEQIEEALNTALTYTDYDWEKDILPWLGDRVAIGVVTLVSEPEDGAPNYYPAPNIVLAVHTRDRDKSDAFLAEFRARRESDLYGNSAIFDEVYRGVSIAYVAYDSAYATYGEAYATIDDVIVMAFGGRDDLEKVIDAAFDGTNLAESESFKDTMGALPSPDVGMAYMDYASFMELMIETTSRSSQIFYEIVSEVGGDTTELERQMEEERRRREQQQEQLRQMLSGFGGAGVTMTYEPSGIRFDLAMQFFPDRLPENVHDLYSFDWSAASNRIFDSIPSSAVVAANMSNPAASWSPLLDSPDWLNLTFGSYPFGGYPFGGDVAKALADFQQRAGVDLRADLLDLLSGEVAIVVLPKPDQPEPSDDDPWAFSYYSRVPFEFALMLDASDSAHVVDSLNRLVETAFQSFASSYQMVQPLDSLPGSALLDVEGDAWLAYGVVDGRLVIGSNPGTLRAIDAGDQSPLSADETFKSAMSALPADRLASGYVQLEPFWNAMFESPYSDSCDACNYLRPFRWMSFASEMPDEAAGIQRGTLHIGIEAGE